MAIAAGEVAAAIGITLLMLVMVISGAAMIVNKISPARSVMMRYTRGMQVMRGLDIVGLLIMIPGTIVLYAVYVRKLWQVSALSTA